MTYDAVHSDFNGLASNTIFCFWTGAEAMSMNRMQAAWSIFQHSGCPVMLVTANNLPNWTLPDSPIHPAYPFLTSTHKSDYLRCYFMHHFGGGYTDLKLTFRNWFPHFNNLRQSTALGLGYPEIKQGIPHLKEHPSLCHIPHNRLIGLCSFIFKRKSELTFAWLEAVHKLLDLKVDALKENPGQHHLERHGIVMPDGRVSNYPLRWAELLGEIFHPLAYHHSSRLIQADIAPKFQNYR